jgi:integrase
MKTRLRPLPPYLKRWFDKRTGKTYLQFRKPGHRGVPLPQPIGSDAFWIAYNAALKSKAEVGADLRSGAGSVSASIASYFASQQWGALADGTRAMQRRILERFRAQYGQWPLRQLNENFLTAYLEPMKPSAARSTFKALRGWLRHARHDVTRGMPTPKVKTNKHLSWPPELIAQFEACHRVGTKARLCFALGKYTGAGCSEIARIGPQHIVDGEITIDRQKTGVPAIITIHPELRAILDATPFTGFSTLLVTKLGKPYSPHVLSDNFRSWCREAGIPPGYRLHGLRHTLGDKLADHEATPHQIAAVLGHASVTTALHYTRESNRKKQARQAMSRLIGCGPNGAHTGNKSMSVDEPSQTLRDEKV